MTYHNSSGSRRDSMGAQAPKPAGNNTPFRTADPTCSWSSNTNVPVPIAVGPTWHSEPVRSEGTSVVECDQRRESKWAEDSNNRSSSTTYSRERTVPDQLAELLMVAIPGMEGAELAEAWQCAAETPPVTKRSLSELDIQNITINIRLRHDVNFDRDLSFRPNLDGLKGQEKRRHSDRYWQALVAELELYSLIFQGTLSSSSLGYTDWSVVVQHAERRIPHIFDTIHEVLKSLVPEQDQGRVDEHVDVPMLMQEIERGVCDLVKMAEWMACLLKEHCAPMRDVWVDEMVMLTRSGVETNNSTLIVSGLRKLLGLLEAMKLDVANHQIRNLKALLIEDTVNFENCYHLDRLVNGKARINIEATQKWWALVTANSTKQCHPAPRDAVRLHFETFASAAVATLFASGDHIDLPDTFYLDQDRWHGLKSELDDLVHHEICLDVFLQLAKGLGYTASVPNKTRSDLRRSLTAIIGEDVGHGPQSWTLNSESLSLEIYRRALALAGRRSNYNSSELQTADRYLRSTLLKFSTYASCLQDTLLSQVIECANKHYNSLPIELFNNLAPAIPSATTHTPFPSFLSKSPQSADTLPQQRLTDLSNRITHILLLHWRIWGPIAYVPQDGPIAPQPSPQPQTLPTQQPIVALGPSTSPHLPSTRPPPLPSRINSDAEVQIPDAMKKEPPDPGEASVARETRWQ